MFDKLQISSETPSIKLKPCPEGRKSWNHRTNHFALSESQLLSGFSFFRRSTSLLHQHGHGFEWLICEFLPQKTSHAVPKSAIRDCLGEINR